MFCNYCGREKSERLSLKKLLLPVPIQPAELCSACQVKFIKISKAGCCYGCSRPSSVDYCLDCQKWQRRYPDYFFHHEALYNYNEGMHEWVEAYKFKGDYHLRLSFSQEINHYFRDKKDVLIIPLPVSEQRLAQRGFNQVVGLLDGAKITYSTYLERVVDNRPQAQKTRAERLALKQPFEVPQKVKEKLKNRSVILVDDIYTTGRTLFHAAEAINDCQVKSLNTFSLAR